MCIIVVKPQGVYLPKKNILKMCFKNNPDGAGIMLSSKKTVYGFKGLMSYTTLEKKIKELKLRFGPLETLPMILHFRIGTSGTNIPENTHPFPVCQDYEQMRKLEWKSKLGMAHNGIISSLSWDQDVKKHNVSDTMIFVKRCAFPLNKLTQLNKDEQLLDLLEIAADSKLAFLDADGKISLRGKFYGKDGCSFSNETYQEKRITVSRAYSWDGYGDYAQTGVKSQAHYLSPYEEKMLREEEAALDGLAEHKEGQFLLMTNGDCIRFSSDLAVDTSSNEIYEWDSHGYGWYNTGDVCEKIISETELTPK